MADMTAAMGDAGGPVVVRVDGVEWRIGHPIQLAKKHLEDLILDGVENRLLGRKAANPAAFAEAWERHERDLRTRRYATLAGDLWQEAAFDRERGPVLLLASLLRCHHPGATEDDAFGLLVAEPERVRAAMLRVLPDFFLSLLDDPRLRRLPPAVREEAAAGLRAAVAELFPGWTPATPSASTS